MKLVTDVEMLVQHQDIIGEGPVWNEQDGRLYWVDCVNRRIQRWDPKKREAKIFPLSKMPGSFAFRRDQPGIIMAFRNALAFVDFENGKEDYFDAGPLQFAQERFNDGACDRAGRFWSGTMDREGKNPVGHLFRIETNLTVTTMESGITSSNGMAWSPDNKTMYYTDSRKGICAYDYDIATGSINNRRMHLDLIARHSHPDGCTVDTDGMLWVAEPDSSCVRQYDLKGNMTCEVRLPVTRPASCTFGGEDMKTLFITTLRYRMTDEALAQQPLAGALFACRPGATGIPEPRFAG